MNRPRSLFSQDLRCDFYEMVYYFLIDFKISLGGVAVSKIFISHSSKDDIVPLFVDYLISIGIPNKNIFCSSLEGNGVKNGERINDTIRSELQNASMVIYLITSNFLKSTYCTQELGASWLLKAKIFVFKFEDVGNSELKGFIDSSFKYNFFNTDGLSSLYDELDEIFKLGNKQAVISRATNKLLVDAKSKIKVLIEDKDKTDEEIQAERIKMLEKQYDSLSIGEKRIIGSIYFCEDAVCYYQISNGTVALLEKKSFVYRVSSVSCGLLQFAYTLQPWVIDMVNRMPKIKIELEKIIKKKPMYNDDLW